MNNIPNKSSIIKTAVIVIVLGIVAWIWWTATEGKSIIQKPMVIEKGLGDGRPAETLGR